MIRAALTDRIAALDAQRAIALSTDFEGEPQVDVASAARENREAEHV